MFASANLKYSQPKSKNINSDNFSFDINMYTHIKYFAVILRLSLSSIHRDPRVLRACLQATGAEVEDKVVGGPLEGK